MASKAANTAEAPEAREEAAEAPLLNTVEAAIKKMVAKGKERGYVTYDEVNAALPTEQVSSEQIQDTLSMLSELGINVVESEETEEAASTEEGEGGEPSADGAPPPGVIEDEADEDTSISLAAMEAELKPSVLATLDGIAALYKKLHKLQEQRLANLQEGEELAKPTEKRYDKLKSEMIEAMKSVRLNNPRIEHLVEQLYTLNRRLVACEGKLLRMAESCGVKRQDFLNHHMGQELVPDWSTRVKRLHGKGWGSLVNKHGAEVKALRGDIVGVSEEAGLPPIEFRRIVQTVQRGDREAGRAKKSMF